jgi:putative oxidoreductase
MPSERRRTRLIIPALAPLHQRLAELAYPFIRLVCGAMLVPHGWQKFASPATQANMQALFEKLGFTPVGTLFWLVATLELAGGAMLAIGLLTRPVALLVGAELMVITFDVFWPNGFFAGQRGYEHTLLWGLVALAIAWRGGGRYSADRLIGWEF